MDQVAVVIGGGQTLGAYLCEGLAEAGYKVAVADLNEENAKKIAAQSMSVTVRNARWPSAWMPQMRRASSRWLAVSMPVSAGLTCWFTAQALPKPRQLLNSGWEILTCLFR